VPPIRVAGVMIRHQDKIIEPHDDRLFSIGTEINMDRLPTTFLDLSCCQRIPFNRAVKHFNFCPVDLSLVPQRPASKPGPPTREPETSTDSWSALNLKNHVLYPVRRIHDRGSTVKKRYPYAGSSTAME
jgi:hypothetical protein